MIHAMSDGPAHKEIAARLRIAMAEAGIGSAAELARLLGQEESRVRNWVNGTARPKVDEARRLKPLLRINLDWLYDNDGSGLPYAIHLRFAARAAGLIPPNDADSDDAPALALEAARPARKASRRAKALATSL